MSIPLRNALSLQNIRIHVPSTFTVGISTNPVIMQNAAERLLGLAPPTIEEMASEIIFGQLRLTVASLTIEEINQDREKFLAEIRRNVEPELNKIGLYLVNVNITDINDESDTSRALVRKRSEAINRAQIEVAEQDESVPLVKQKRFENERFASKKTKRNLSKVKSRPKPTSVSLFSSKKLRRPSVKPMPTEKSRLRKILLKL